MVLSQVTSLYRSIDITNEIVISLVIELVMATVSL